MAAGFQRHIHHSALRGLLTGCQSIPLCMELPASLVISLPDDPVILYNHRSNHGIGTGKAPGFPRQLYGSSHIFFRLHTHHLSDFSRQTPACTSAALVCQRIAQKNPVQQIFLFYRTILRTSYSEINRLSHFPYTIYLLLPSRLYCRPRNLTGSCLTARGLILSYAGLPPVGTFTPP